MVVFTCSCGYFFFRFRFLLWSSHLQRVGPLFRAGSTVIYAKRQPVKRIEHSWAKLMTFCRRRRSARCRSTVRRPVGVVRSDRKIHPPPVPTRPSRPAKKGASLHNTFNAAPPWIRQVVGRFTGRVVQTVSCLPMFDQESLISFVTDSIFFSIPKQYLWSVGEQQFHTPVCSSRVGKFGLLWTYLRE